MSAATSFADISWISYNGFAFCKQHDIASKTWKKPQTQGLRPQVVQLFKIIGRLK